MPEKWSLTQQAFDLFLARLDADRECASQRYLQLRHSLTRILEWKGSQSSEEQADETINRVCRKLEEGLAIEDIAKYCHTVLNFVFLESLKKPDARREEFDEQSLAQIPASETRAHFGDERLSCLQKCLGKLPDDNRRLIVGYYQGDQRAKIENRRRLAEQLGITAHNLNVRASRIRERLQDCVSECLKNSSIRL